MSNNQPPKTPMGGPGGGAAIPMGKANNFGKAIGHLLKYCKKFLPGIILAIVLAMVGTVFSILGPNILGNMTDLITEGLVAGIDLNAILELAVTLLSLYLISALFNYTQGFIMATVTQKVSYSLRGDISGKINRLPLKYFDAHSYGDVLSRVTNDVDTIGQTLNQAIVSLLTSVTTLVGVLIMMFTINPIMAVTAIGATMVGFILMMVILMKSQKYFIQQQVILGELNGHIEETFSGHNVVKVYNASNQEQKKFSGINKRLYNSAWKAQFMSGMMMPLMGFVGNLGFVAVCVVGGALAINGTIKIGVITAFMIYVRLFSQPLNSLAQSFTSMQSTAAASERVFEFLHEKELDDESAKSTQLDNIKGDISFRNVVFGYDPDRIIIHDFSMDIKAGSKVAIVGPTGAGKTTMVNLLMRFYETNSGDILIDGVSIKDLTRENIHELFGMVLQDTWLFEGSVRDNIVYSKEGISDEDLTKVCKAAGLDHLIRTLPHGYDTILDDKTSISAGQKQLMTIARAMVENAPMLILDEATSSVDTRSEALIQKAMDAIMLGRTSFVIAHRLSTIKNSDVILVMKDGDIVESGTHNELLEKGGFYNELYNSQFDKNS